MGLTDLHNLIVIDLYSFLIDLHEAMEALDKQHRGNTTMDKKLEAIELCAGVCKDVLDVVNQVDSGIGKVEPRPRFLGSTSQKRIGRIQQIKDFLSDHGVLLRTIDRYKACLDHAYSSARVAEAQLQKTPVDRIAKTRHAHLKDERWNTHAIRTMIRTCLRHEIFSKNNPPASVLRERGSSAITVIHVSSRPSPRLQYHWQRRVRHPLPTQNEQ